MLTHTHTMLRQIHGIASSTRVLVRFQHPFLMVYGVASPLMRSEAFLISFSRALSSWETIEGGVKGFRK